MLLFLKDALSDAGILVSKNHSVNIKLIYGFILDSFSIKNQDLRHAIHKILQLWNFKM